MINKTKICPCCLKIFKKHPELTYKRWEKRKFCSPKCGQIKIPIKEYKKKRLQELMSNSKITQSGCIEWQGASGEKGYGWTVVLGKVKHVHRHIYQLIHGELPNNIHVLHSCDNTKCINPEHLFPGTNYDNVQDMVSKGRQAKGFNKPNCKLANKDKEEIIKLRQKGESYLNIAQIFNINKRYANQIILNYLKS